MEITMVNIQCPFCGYGPVKLLENDATDDYTQFYGECEGECGHVFTLMAKMRDVEVELEEEEGDE